MRTFCVVPVLVLLVVMVARAEEEATPPRPTLRILQEMMSSAADSLFGCIPDPSGQTVMATVLPPKTSWYLEQPVIDVLRARALLPSQSADAAYSAELGVTRSGVLYQNPRRTWFLGSQIVDRSVQLSVWAKLIRTKTGEVLVAHEFTRGFTDTVAVADLDALETPGIPATRGVIPSPGLFGSFVEPVVLVGSIAVAIVLLFSVRS